MSTRTPYEQTQLARHGIRNQELADEPDAPVEYITEKCEASGFLFTVTADTLIPRIETEKLIELSLNSLRKILESSSQTNPIHILDVGTGSGYVGITLAKKITDEYPELDVQLVLSDISAKALSIAHLNCVSLLRDSHTKPKVHFKTVRSDLLQNIDIQQFHVITANLPYIPSARIAQLDKSVTQFEPHIALDGGTDGLAFILKLLEQVPEYLDKKGSVWLEVDHTHTTEVLAQTLTQYNLDSKKFQLTFFCDDFGKNRFVEVSVG